MRFTFDTAEITIDGNITNITDLSQIGVTYDDQSGQFTLDPTAITLFQMLDDGETASVVIDFTVTDGALADLGTMTLLVTGANDQVMATDDRR